MVWEFAGDFIHQGATFEERQNRLTAACSAWNIASESPEARDGYLYKYLKGYAEHNPEVDDEDIAAICSDMEKLIAARLSLFPDVRIRIVSGHVISTRKGERIEVVSLRME
jgi:hypothetical protein